MNNIRRVAQYVGMCSILVAAAGLLSGCGDSYANNRDLVAYDAEEPQIPPDAEKTTTAASPENVPPTAEESPAAADTESAEKAKSPAAQDDVKLVAAVDAPPAAAESQVKGPLPPKSAGDRLPGRPFIDDPASLIPSEPREVKLLVPTNSFQKVGPEDALRVSYDDLDLLKVLNMDPVTLNATELMPTWLKELDGKRIRLRGFMYPPFTHTDIRSFVLARDNQICCFGRNPKPYDVIQILMRDGVTVDYIQNRPFDVVGTFHIELQTYDDKKVDGLYFIDDAIVIDK